MTKVGNVHVACNAPGDWVVAEEGSKREFGHYATRAEAEAVGAKLARKRKAELIVQDETGKQTLRPTSRGWFSRLFGR